MQKLPVVITVIVDNREIIQMLMKARAKSKGIILDSFTAKQIFYEVVRVLKEEK